MNTNRSQIAGAAMAAMTLMASPLALGQRPPGPPPGGGGQGGATQQAPAPKGDIQELGKAGDRFLAWRVAHIEGAEFFTKDQEELREHYREVEKKIREAVTEDRLKEKTARENLVMLLKIGGDADAGDEVTETALKNLEGEIQAALVDNAKAETLTPHLNRVQWQVTEILLYGAKTSNLSNGKMATLTRKLVSNEEKEASAKEDGEISDRELEKVEEDAIEIWSSIIKEFRKKDD